MTDSMYILCEINFSYSFQWNLLTLCRFVKDKLTIRTKKFDVAKTIYMVFDFQYWGGWY